MTAQVIAPATQVPPALSLQALYKDFGGTRALDGASLEVAKGSIHGLVGQNGAGKSTLIKILAGLHRPDGGAIAVDGAFQDHLTPHRAENLGIHFIHQERLLVPSFSVGEALFVGQESLAGSTRLLNRRKLQAKATSILRERFDLALPADALIGDLTVAQQQIVQVTRALLANPSILVFDEPTAALVKREVDVLLETIRRLRQQGLTIVYISHYLSEIEAICDRVTVLRNGKDVATVDPQATSASEIAALMIARDVTELFPKQAVQSAEPILQISGLGRPPAFADVSFTVRRGEIVGLTGLLGSGAKELLRSLFGLEKPSQGSIEIDGAARSIGTPRAAMENGIAFVPEDRRGQRIAAELSVRENISLASLRLFSRFNLVQRKRERAHCDRLIERLGIRTAGGEAPVKSLSGGNQQKVALAKWLSRQSRLYILDEPTIGVDIGAKADIYRLLGELAAGGAGILILSTDLIELTGICDRVLVMFRGRLIGDFSTATASGDAIFDAATGAAERGIAEPAAAELGAGELQHVG
ncbi:MAG TPA: sugar ABC transporter ATP-binding protein [Dongiaceae bacterium]|nr:sugar ABC transporter ATP-binding protein [Dongiaceae bacterium]